ncbi:MAG: membrane integrity-associated transporter subunit PqiC [Candidatus Hydrogenedentes bacterium]|nr:membrane integrity-associated transporter subunit PqiC [Candidatus Hydrogenedentota bacterium]
MNVTHFKHICLALAVVGLAAGCATAPGPNLYTLNMTPASGDSGGVQIAVGRLRISEALQNKRILIKKSPTEIEYYAAAQWAAGLDELLAEKLGAEFGQPDPAGATCVLSGTLLAFEQIDGATGAEAHVRFAVEIRKEGTSYYSPPALAKTYDVRLPVAEPTAGGVVRSLSECLEQVAREIVADTSALG